ncbi:hypothetical protein PUNSTDRAFT_118369 [Punctularia strigosozonata HHB-11173 SS5]|uniref:uncharacterized protein n=1 Tax=Punctularia strigosozonata (strain HHB-11173) TaxID=741275 RepID=UPI000441661D|nr:uncharacterized protein PUNSTDRAFT_118369 [Punctularia strigosozonata HHB-11173 SS5]EIN12594.1 hypothetical protein PUNSTDRAFT_118369 [Punctularia strigosozonata HHB-11173 SS5]
MSDVLEYLMGLPKSSDSATHWFCVHAKPVTREAATFLIRLFAFDGRQANEWKERLKDCLTSCALCVKCFQEVKFTSRRTYFGVFSDNILATFWSAFDKWERQLVKEQLSKATSSSAKRCTLEDLPTPLITHLLSNTAMLLEPDLLDFVCTSIPSGNLDELPMDPPPVCVWYLALHEDDRVRQWSKEQMMLCKRVPISAETFEVAYHRSSLMDDAIAAISGKGRKNSVKFPFAVEAGPLWSAFVGLIRLLPPELLKPRDKSRADVSQIILGHLHDQGSHFQDVLKCFLYLLQRLGSELWKGEKTEYPQVIFDAIKDNHRYVDLVASTRPGIEKPWHLGWYTEFLQSLWKHAQFPEILARMTGFVCEELQHERFEDVRPIIMLNAVRTLRWALLKDEGDEDKKTHQAAVLNALDIHADILVTVAFGKPYRDAKWASARNTIRDFIKIVLIMDQQHVSASITQLCRILARHDTAVVVPSVRTQMWQKMYRAVQGDDSDAVATLVAILARSAHMGFLHESAFKAALEGSPARDAFTKVNQAFQLFRNGFVDTISRYTNYSNEPKILDMLQRPGLVKDIVMLMFSPSEEMHSGAQNLVEQAFNVDGRADCFRALLENLPHATLSAIFDVLETFVQYAPIVPEACSFSKVLVLCLTDILEVLCSTPDGLLRHPRFLKPEEGSDLAAEIRKLWTWTTKAIALVFKRTPAWSAYFDSEEMILWMRDALIFGRDLLSQRRFLTSVVATGPQQPRSGNAGSTKKAKQLSLSMINDLQVVLPELVRWLRLTNEELLYQSFALVQSLLECFHEAGVSPPHELMGKLRRHVEDGRNKQQKQTRLDASRIDKLEQCLAAFEDSDDDVEIVEVKQAPPTQVKLEKNRERVPSAAPKPSVTSRKALEQKQDVSAGQGTSSRLPPVWDRKAGNQLTVLPRAPPGTSKIASSAPAKSSTTTIASGGDSSSSSSEDEESEGDERGLKGLAALANLQSTPKIKKPERRQVKLLDIPTGKNPMQERLNKRDDIRRNGLRLKPDISGLHRAVLSWDYDHNGNEPPFKEPPKLLRVPDSFRDHDQYRSVFEPLLLLECWAQIVQSKDEPAETYECQLISRQFVDDWMDVDITIGESVRKDWSLGETDIVLLRQPESKRAMLAKVQTYRASPRGIQATLRCSNRAGGDSSLQLNTTWRVRKVFSLSTLHREYASLMALPYYDFFHHIMRPRLGGKPRLQDDEVKSAMKAYGLNEPQAKAVLSSLRAESFSLIQGPPGTGKTSTICGLVQAYLASRRKPATNIQAGRATAASDTAPVKKVLVCAPSNAAIDEVASRLKEGLSGSGKRGIQPKVVRVGADKALNISVKDIALDALVEQKMNAAPNAKELNKDSNAEIIALRQEIEAVKQQRAQKFEEITNTHDNAVKTQSLEEEARSLNAKRMALSQRLDKLRDQQKSASRSLDAARRKYRTEVLQEADVICSTLSGAGHDVLEALEIDLVIIDEAAQAIELSTLIPLKYPCKRCVMVGDPQQLPPTVLSQEACKYQYNQSLFVRLLKDQPEAIHLLSIQYRMHPEISRLPSQIFYDGRLQDGPDMAEKTKQPWHRHAKFGPYRFFNVNRGQEEPGRAKSLMNKAECQVAVALYTRLRREFSSIDLDFRVGVVSMYRAQIFEMRRAFEQRFGAEIVGKVDFNTVDGFQGQEKDVIILSCVRAGANLHSVGFLSDTRRMNVALTRARSSLFVLGHSPTLENGDKTWSKIVNDARSRSCHIDVDVNYFTTPGHSTLPSPIPSVKNPVRSVAQRQDPAVEGLMTPKELASGPSKAPVLKRESASDLIGNQVDGAKKSKHVVPEKRRAPVEAEHEHSADESAASRKPSVQNAKPKGPPPKRQKQGPNLFIPKTNKRPGH